MHADHVGIRGRPKHWAGDLAVLQDYVPVVPRVGTIRSYITGEIAPSSQSRPLMEGHVVHSEMVVVSRRLHVDRFFGKYDHFRQDHQQQYDGEESAQDT